MVRGYRKYTKEQNAPAQLPVESKKKPVAHLAQAVPLSAVVQPARQLHCPFDPQLPFWQLQLEGGLMTVAVKQRPLPEIPSSQDVQPLGHCWHVGPKKPAAQDSHEVPLKPVGQVHEPAAEQTPDPEQGGEHAADCMSTRERDAEEPEGN
jgi:hypothetical protein